MTIFNFFFAYFLFFTTSVTQIEYATEVSKNSQRTYLVAIFYFSTRILRTCTHQTACRNR